jgi:lysophospholipase L1-like esterase
MHFNRIWSRSGDFAIERFQTFEKNAMPDKGLKSFNWALQIHTMLAQKGLRAVFVLTPLNKDLVWAYTSPDSARFLIGYLDYAHNEFKSFLTINRMTSIDLYGAADRNEFADLVHTNEKGDDTIARAMAVWIKNNPYQATLSQISH